MAGGMYAAAVPCLRCAERADRVVDGLETDYYRCTACGYQFGIDWATSGPPQTPCWPISPADAQARRQAGAQMFGAAAQSAPPPPSAPAQSSRKPWWKFW